MWMLKARKLFKSVGFEALTLLFALRDPSTPGNIKLLTLAMLFYTISPIDLVPDFLAIFGWADDIALLMLGVPVLVKRLPDRVRMMAEEKASRLLCKFIAYRNV